MRLSNEILQIQKTYWEGKSYQKQLKCMSLERELGVASQYAIPTVEAPVNIQERQNRLFSQPQTTEDLLDEMGY